MSIYHHSKHGVISLPGEQAYSISTLFNYDRTHYAIFGVGILLLLIAVTLSLCIGSKNIPLEIVLDSLFGQQLHDDSIIILDSRLPRTIVGIFAGAGLGIAGALIQAITRNPLADPGIFGVNAGASFAVLIGISFFGIQSITGYLWFAFAGALITTTAVYLVGASGTGHINPLKLTLAGVAIGALLVGISSGLTLIDPETYDKMRFWNAGSLDIRNLDIALLIIPVILLGAIIALLLAKPLNALSLGQDLGATLGINIRFTLFWAVIAITLLSGTATAATGPVGFVGLMIPHMARWLVGPNQGKIIIFTLIFAPSLLLFSDIIGRVIIAGELRVSIVTAFIGAPVLIWLARKNRSYHQL